jgi:nucleoid-associated protein YgaU
MRRREHLLGVSIGALICALGSSVAAQTLVGDGTVGCGAESYVVVPGDTLSEIAGRAYGDPMLFRALVDANPDVLGGNPEAIEVGMELAIPCLDASGQPVAADAAATMEAAMAAEGPLTAAELDTLFGPVALFPDQVLTPVLVATTFPLDVVKAGRFIEENAELSDEERSAQALAQPWDDSVKQLAAGFPDLVTRMNDHIDWTEQAGEAVVAQTDDVLGSIQRLRAKAQETGYLADGPTQTVEVVNNVITIAPTEPNVVYVPTYDSQVVYTTPVTAPPYYYYDDGDDWEDALATGAIILGGAIILDEIFDDNDWDGWDNDDIDWDGGDIDIERGDREVSIGGGDREINIDRDTTIGGDRTNISGGDRTTIGSGDRDRPDAATRPGSAGTADRDAARAKIEGRKASGGTTATLPASRPNASRATATDRRATEATRPSTTNRSSQVSRPQTTRQPTARTPSRSNTFSNTSGSRSQSVSASNRGRSSAGSSGRSGGGRSGGGRR